LTTEKIKEALLNKQEATGKKTRLCVIDYLECISSGISDPTAKISEIAQELKDIAIELDICILLLLQPPKRVGDPSKKILSYTDIKGAATVGQACSIVMSLWREGFNPERVENDRFISFAALKNRMGQLCQIDCIFDGLKGDVYEMDDCDREDLEQIRTLKKKYEDDL
jgi:replicative DNA helicase